MIQSNINIRRFHVFAEYSRIEKIISGIPADEAKGYGIWLAKVVAARMWTDRAQLKDHKWGERNWLTYKGEPQTDQMFDIEIVVRIGHDFYEQVFSPAIKEAIDRGEKYENIRDSIRAEWQPFASKKQKEKAR